MLILVLLAIHAGLILLYGLAVRCGKSRHTYPYLLFAALLPGLGEICLLVTEFGKHESSTRRIQELCPVKETQFVEHGYLPFNKKEITRPFLLNAIGSEPFNLAEILKAALRSPDPEIVHMAASAIMHLRTRYEQQIQAAEQRYLDDPAEPDALRQAVRLIGDYCDQQLLQDDMVAFFLRRQEHWLKVLHEALPRDADVVLAMKKNREAQVFYRDHDESPNNEVACE